ncbi:cobalamin biosynthesis protein CobD [Alicycliphilus denitrificans]|uniref:Cobalamin biosynthesis protein CobD n=2 Tax=Alicycliphilus denitrificans TaxID=179636 RepID=F4GC31_ALIDK|nr:adenosylcobinamide-phosphate synthase CbiB [Alicycliphilus denitrificans]ADV00968.1 cobalamin biosynthesis protein CobD [Alicycliphilus denitrificans BC]AEB83605.1 cobalamin biosynthesis protein CobD [Alicycliphilus denitrificans K601]QKD45123.1 cobalamin biosynthesis protein CobD [Alicycliphilus denitrificans]GAO24556.1 cobalamin biosynthesis protein CobD [Alicycliphilus sp. B1]
MPFPILDAAAAAVALLLALSIDRWWGEPPAALHPVVWMGRALGACGARVAPAQATGRDLWSFWLAAIAWCALAAIVLVVFGVLQWTAVAHLPAWGAALALGLLLKPLLAWRMLRREVLAVEAALGESLEVGRARLAWLVSRDVRQLDEAQVRESAIESLAENLSDSVVAPLFWFVLLGLPGAALYRFANTADAMWGYPDMRGGRYWQWAGKWAARADDALSWLPARLTALLLWLAARGGVRWGALRALARATPSPNGGWPMGAMALALGVRLSKPGVYVLNAAGRAARAEDTRRAVDLASRSIAALIPLLLAALLLIAIVRRHV